MKYWLLPKLNGIFTFQTWTRRWPLHWCRSLLFNSPSPTLWCYQPQVILAGRRNLVLYMAAPMENIPSRKAICRSSYRFICSIQKANELMMYSYAHLFQLSCTGLRFFTVYSPWGSDPIWHCLKLTHNLLADKSIDVYNHGNMSRDFTYIDNIVDGILLTLDHPLHPNSAWPENQPHSGTSKAPYQIYNIGSNNPIPLIDVIAVLEKALNKKAIKNFLLPQLQPSDFPETYGSKRFSIST